VEVAVAAQVLVSPLALERLGCMWTAETEDEGKEQVPQACTQQAPVLLAIRRRCTDRHGLGVVEVTEDLLAIPEEEAAAVLAMVRHLQQEELRERR